MAEKNKKECQRKKKRRERIIKSLKSLKGTYDDSLSTDDLEDKLTELEDLIEEKDEDKNENILDKDPYKHYRQYNNKTGMTNQKMNSLGLTQFTISKTDISIYDYLNDSSAQQIFANDKVFHITIIFARNSLLETEQWVNRVKKYTYSVKGIEKYALVFSSKSDDVKSRGDIVKLLSEAEKEKDLPSALMMCNHWKRIDDMIYIIEKFYNDVFKLNEKTGYRTLSFSIIFDEGPKGCMGINKFLKSNIANIKDTDKPLIISDIMYMSATPEDKHFWKTLKDNGINELNHQWMYKQLEERNIDIDKKFSEYRSIKDHKHIYVDNHTQDPVEYVKHILDKNIIKNTGNNLNIFAPAGFKCESHEKMSRIFQDKDFIVMVHNGKTKEFRFPTGQIISIKKYKTQYNISGELYDILTHFRAKFDGNIAITGLNTVGTGVTFNTTGFGFTHSIYSSYHSTNRSELQQLLGRSTGNSAFCKRFTIICPKNLMVTYQTIMDNKYEILKSRPKYIKEETFIGLDKEDFLAKTIPLIFKVEEKELHNLMIKQKNMYNKHLFETFLFKKPDWDKEYNKENLIQVSWPDAEGSYKKHITNMIKLAKKEQKGVIEFKIKDKEKYYRKKCWFIFIDKREKRLVIIRWNGTKLDTGIS